MYEVKVDFYNEFPVCVECEMRFRPVMLDSGFFCGGCGADLKKGEYDEKQLRKSSLSSPEVQERLKRWLGINENNS